MLVRSADFAELDTWNFGAKYCTVILLRMFLPGINVNFFSLLYLSIALELTHAGKLEIIKDLSCEGRCCARHVRVLHSSAIAAGHVSTISWNFSHTPQVGGLKPRSNNRTRNMIVKDIDAKKAKQHRYSGFHIMLSRMLLPIQRCHRRL